MAEQDKELIPDLEDIDRFAATVTWGALKETLEEMRVECLGVVRSLNVEPKRIRYAQGNLDILDYVLERFLDDVKEDSLAKLEEMEKEQGNGRSDDDE